ncbi:MAG: hypothetical protein MIO92_14625 [Methanosarcinaceae archaeon]|nr:hypothetical protein [Methanosarcinaceae archaeon]
MFNQLVPRQADNSFQGRKPALWILAFVLLLLAAMSVNSIFNGRYVAKDIDGLPLDTYTPAGAQAVVSLFAIWGGTQLIIVMLGIIVLLRYRALVPLMFLVLLFQRLLMQVIHHYLPNAKSEGVSISWFVILLISLTALGFILSIWRRRAEA